MKINIVDPKRFIIFISIISLIIISIISGVIFLLKDKNESERDTSSRVPTVENTRQVYEVLVQIADQTSDDLEEDKSSSLKTGDVIAIFPENHSWSETEKISNLILKIKLTEKDGNKLLEPVTKEIDSNDKEKRPRTETIRARKYRIRIENLDFDLQKFWDNPIQPYFNQIFDDSVIQEKL